MRAGAQMQALRPLLDFVEPVDTPIFSFLQLDQLAPGKNPLENIFVADAWTDLNETRFTLGAEFFLKGLKGLHLPGIDQVRLSFNGDDSASGLLVCGADPFFSLEDIEVTLEIDKVLLADASGNDATITTNCAVWFDEGGFHFRRFGKASLRDAVIGGTGIGISLIGIDIDPSDDAFLKIDNVELKLPMFPDSAGDPLVLRGENLLFGRSGPSGTVRKLAGEPLKVSLHAFPCEIAEASARLENGHLVEAELTGRMDLSAFLADGTQDGWVSASFHIGSSGIMAALSADSAIVEMHVHGAFSLAVDTIRLDASNGSEAVLWLSGVLTPEIDGVDGNWPAFEFDEIGITSGGEIRLADGGSIKTTQPFSLKWHFARITVTSFTLQRPQGGGTGDLELRLSAGVELLQGIPAGASVDGLVVTKRRGQSATVRFDGIGIHYGSPGSFDVAVTISWNSAQNRFTGSGHLDISSLDLRLDVVFAAGEEPTSAGRVTTVFAVAEMSLPGGVPIGATGLSLYGVSGMLAYNKEIDLAGRTGPRRYFERFNDGPKKGFATEDKWVAREGAGALGLGVVIGTGDDGWAFSCRGALLLTFPDVAILATATGNLLSRREPMDGGDGKLSAVLAVLPAEQLVRFDFSVQWNQDPLFEVEGSGGGEFHFDRPMEWMVFAGKKPPEGRPISARSLRLGGSYLISTDYWFKIDAARSANVGMTAGIDRTFGPSELHVELSAHISANAKLSWNPAQFEGCFGLTGRARLVAGGLSLGLDVSSTPSVEIASPKELQIPLKACIDIDLGIKKFEMCLAFTVAWVDRKWPALEPFVHGLSAVPRYWTPRLTSDPNAPQDTGIVSKILDLNNQTVDLGSVQPHSELVLEFSKSMAVDLRGRQAQLNDVTTPFPSAIGSKSGWAAAWTITDISLRNVSDNLDVDLFGTFSRSPIAREDQGRTVSPRPPNTELRLLSSRRFGQDGSLGGGGADQAPGVDCKVRASETRTCIALAGLKTGPGTIENGWPSLWDAFGDPRRRSNTYGVRLAPEDRFTIFTPPTVNTIFLTLADFDAQSKPVPGTERDISVPVPAGIAEFRGFDAMLVKLCWGELVVDSGAGPSQGWRGSSGTEEWTLPDAEKRLLIPNRDYELKITAEAQLIQGTNKRGGPSIFARRYTFRTARAPDWEDALRNAIAGKYPDDGDRPVFRNYDLLVRFKDDFFEALYRLDKRILGVRIRDSNGRVVTGPNGTILLPSSWSDGSITRSPNEAWWIGKHLGNPASDCEQSTPVPPSTGRTVLPIMLKDFNLAPLERYVAELLAVDTGGGDANPTAVLASWSFTTSAYKTYSDLVSAPSDVPALGLVSAGTAPVDAKFDSLIRAFQGPIVTHVDQIRVTPVRADDALAYFLVESPEPLDDDLGRLAMKVDGTAADLVFNLDRTRLVASLKSPVLLVDPQAEISVEFEWNPEPKGALAEQKRSVGGMAGPEGSKWLVPIERLF